MGVGGTGGMLYTNTAKRQVASRSNAANNSSNNSQNSNHSSSGGYRPVTGPLSQHIMLDKSGSMRVSKMIVKESSSMGSTKESGSQKMNMRQPSQDISSKLSS